MYQKQISSLIGEISQLAIDVTFSKRAHVWVDFSGHVQSLRVKIADVNDSNKVLYSKPWVTLNGEGYIRQDKIEKEAINDLLEIKLELQKYLNVNPFQSIWDQFKDGIEKEIVFSLKHNMNYSTDSLFYDVELETSTKPLTLSDVFESYKLTAGEATATLFKVEMYDNIEWVDKLIHMNWSEYEKEEAV